MDTIKIIVINGSPRKNFTTAALLESFVRGAKTESENVDVKQINLYDYKFTGCKECYLCKMRGGKIRGQCGLRDDISELLREVSSADILALGAPVFFGDFNAQSKAFLERLLFPLTSYSSEGEVSISPKKIRTAVFSAMNMTEEYLDKEYSVRMDNTTNWIEYIFGYSPLKCYATNTYQFRDYTKYEADLWDETSKRKWKDEQLPKDIEKANEIGRELVQEVQNENNL